MSGIFEMSKHQNYQDSVKSTCSLESEGGPSPLNSAGSDQDFGMQIPLFGLDHVPAKISATPTQQAKKKDSEEIAISGLSFNDSLWKQSRDLNLSLGSKLRARLGMFGSPEFQLTSTPFNTDSGLPHFRLRASVRRINEADYSGWPTPKVQDLKHGSLTVWEQNTKHQGTKDSLRYKASQAAGWPTPQTADSWVPSNTTENTLRRGDPNGTLRTTTGSLAKEVKLAAGWPTSQVVDSGKLGNRANFGQIGLTNHPKLRGLPNREKKSNLELETGYKRERPLARFHRNSMP